MLLHFAVLWLQEQHWQMHGFLYYTWWCLRHFITLASNSVTFLVRRLWQVSVHRLRLGGLWVPPWPCSLSFETAVFWSSSSTLKGSKSLNGCETLILLWIHRPPQGTVQWWTASYKSKHQFLWRHIHCAGARRTEQFNHLTPSIEMQQPKTPQTILSCEQKPTIRVCWCYDEYVHMQKRPLATEMMTLLSIKTYE
jgi:hypothetical protein